MGILAAQQIRQLSISPLLEVSKRAPLIHPFFERTVVRGMTYGLSSAGYDVRIAQDKILFPSGFLLASVLEKLNMPDNILAIVHDKSTWARHGVACQNTVVEPGWRGHLTLELSNYGNDVVTFRRGDPICQLIFHRLEEPTDQPYDGKYQDQEAEPQEARFEK